MAPPTDGPNGHLTPPLRVFMNEHTSEPHWALYGAEGGSPRATGDNENTLKFHFVTHVRVQPYDPADPVEGHQNCTLDVRGIKWTLPPGYAVGLATGYKKEKELHVHQVEVELETWLTLDQLQRFIAGGAAVEVPE
ncbi:hypothetical protein INS49_014046 [Diaporthe citri]|uniref:uncharacterized protein n=1 Tax=Diaporthe citri TaxID=83186 RepID=UPI001C801C2E|nr:uncharacterized protein INS49_014046 [Diaporthe citri]KAG6358162.1 hypothetical protein INS49_014046 [Diaporthe citri]